MDYTAETSKTDHTTKLPFVLTHLMREHHTDDTKLSKATGIPISTISRMRNNRQANPTALTLRPIANYFGISLDELLGYAPLSQSNLLPIEDDRQFVATTLPLLKWEQAVPWVSQETAELKASLSQWLKTERDASQFSFALTVTSDTFGPAFRKGSILLFDPSIHPKDGDIVLLELPESNQLALKKIIIDGDDVFIQSLNPEIKETKKLHDGSLLLGVLFETRYVVKEPVTDPQTNRLSKPLLLHKLIPALKLR